MIIKDNVLDESWNGESLLNIRTALQALLKDLGDSIESAAGGKPASIELSAEPGDTVLSVTITLDNNDTVSTEIDLQDFISAMDVAVEVVNHLRSSSGDKALSAAQGLELDRKASVLLEHMHCAVNYSLNEVDINLNEERLFYEPTNRQIYRFVGIGTGGGRSVFTDKFYPRYGVLYFDKETSTYWRWEGVMVLVSAPWCVIGMIPAENVQPTLGVGETSKLFFLTTTSKLAYLYKVDGTTYTITFDPDPSKIYSYPTSGGSKAVRWDGTQWVDVCQTIDTSQLQPRLNAGTGISIDGNEISVDAEVVQPATPDGTFVIRIGTNTYTVNLNHTHENMAKLIVCEESDLPSTLDEDTIYGVNEGGEISMLYIGGIPFYGGGGDSTEPALRQPAAGSVIDMGDYASGTLESTIKVKGRKLTEALTVELDGTGFAFAQTQPSGVTVVSTTELTVTAEAANTLSGVDIAVVYTGTQYNAQGTFGVNSSEVSCECAITASYVGLPTGYTRCEFIQSDTIERQANNTYINTGVNVTSELRIVGKYSYTPANEWKSLFGMYLNDQAALRGMTDNNGYRIYFNLSGSSYGSEYKVADSLPHEFDLDKQRLIFDGVRYPSATSSEWTTDKKLYFFSLNNASNGNVSEGAIPGAKIYYFKIFNGSTLVRYFVAAYNQSTSKYGMYDLVNDQFYPSSGSRDFTGQLIS